MKPIPFFRCFGPVIVLALSWTSAAAQGTTPTFSEVAVHDPSVVRDAGRYYVFGSHLASAVSDDLQHWTQLSSTPTVGNPLAPNPTLEFQEAITWTSTGGGEWAFWAPDVIRLPDGRYAYYYCIGRLDQPRAALGVAFSSSITGPYVHDAILLRSGPGGQPPEAGATYDARIHPNTVDPALFYDQGSQLWMVYGSYSGGIFILRMDSATGRPVAGQGYGKKLWGGQHARIEGGYVLYSPESNYYYLFVSYGGLAADGGYNIRVGRSRTPDGPYVDAAGTDLSTVAGAPNSLFDDASIAPHGVKLMGNYQFLAAAGEPRTVSRGYRSPGHNSAYYDPATGKHFLVFHTRFVGRGEQHEVRVHPMAINADDWPVVAPHRYAQESFVALSSAQVRGSYKFINHGKTISPDVRNSTTIELASDGTVTGALTGTWQLSGDYDVTLTGGGSTYRGVFLRQWDDDQQVWVMTFSALSADGTAIWGSRLASAVAEPAPVISLQPQAVRARDGAMVALAVGATGAISYEWRRNDAVIPGATGATLLIPSVSAADAGDYTVHVSNDGGTVISQPASLTVHSSGSSRIANLSVRTNLSAGQTLIVGFYSAGAKEMLVRAAGPSLAVVAPTLTNLHPDPHLALYNGQTVVDENDDWQTWPEPLLPVFPTVGAFAFEAGAKDAALRRSVDGGRTVHIRGNGSGIVLVEAYDSGGSGRLANVSARNRAGTGDNILIAGFYVAGEVAKTVVIRGLGPALPDSVPNRLVDPKLALFDVAGQKIAENDNWDSAFADLAQSVGAAPPAAGSRDAVVVVTLNPGAYTAQVSGIGGTTGEALVEVFDVP